MVVLDDDGTSSGDSSSTLMDSFSRRDKFRVLQIGGYLNDVGEDEIESEMGAIDRSKTDLDSNAHRASSGGTLGHQAELARARRQGGLMGAGRGVSSDGSRSAFVGPCGQHVAGLGRQGAAGPGGQRAGKVVTLDAVSRAARPGGPVSASCSGSRAALRRDLAEASCELAGVDQGGNRDMGQAMPLRSTVV